MSKLLNTIIENLELRIKHESLKNANECAVLLKEFVFANGYKLDSDSAKRIKDLSDIIDSDYMSILLEEGSIKNCRYALSISDILKEIYSKCGYLTFNETSDLTVNTIKGESILNKSDAEGILEKSIECGMPFITYGIEHRGIGKTTALVKKASELSVTLIVGSHQHKKYADNIARKLGIPVKVFYARKESQFSGVRCHNDKFLIDEGVDSFVINYLVENGNELLGGFVKL